MLFSVIIPTYNRGALIVNTLETVIHQSFRDFEIIVVDDCSTDNTQEILSPYVAQGLIKYIRLQRNSERAIARNTGMQHAEGDYITLLDSDDFMYVDCLKDAAEYVQQHPEIKVFQFHMENGYNFWMRMIYCFLKKLHIKFRSLMIKLLILLQGIVTGKKRTESL